jgi:uncharacterized protein YjcR
MPNGHWGLHGGKSTGAPKGNRNAWKHGCFTAEAVEERRQARKLLREAKALLGLMRDG